MLPHGLCLRPDDEVQLYFLLLDNHRREKSRAVSLWLLGWVTTASAAPLPDWGWPVTGWITSPYGRRDGRKHHGIDIGADEGSPVVASRTGRVLEAGWKGGYGQCVVLDHGEGWTTWYAHLSAWFVQPGQLVQQGEVLGRIGSTGRSTGPHLHFEIRRNSRSLNPARYVRPKIR